MGRGVPPEVGTACTRTSESPLAPIFATFHRLSEETAVKWYRRSQKSSSAATGLADSVQVVHFSLERTKQKIAIRSESHLVAPAHHQMGRRVSIASGDPDF